MVRSFDGKIEDAVFRCSLFVQLSFGNLATEVCCLQMSIEE